MLGESVAVRGQFDGWGCDGRADEGTRPNFEPLLLPDRILPSIPAALRYLLGMLQLLVLCFRLLPPLDFDVELTQHVAQLVQSLLLSLCHGSGLPREHTLGISSHYFRDNSLAFPGKVFVLL